MPEDRQEPIANSVLGIPAWGTESPASSLGVARLLTPILPNVEAIEFKGFGHMAPVTQPQPVNQTIARFLERL
jgi:pimeloyl-ACP methyl ester carboxylesterase